MRLYHIERAWSFSAGQGIDDDYAIPGIEQRVSQVESTNAKIFNRYGFRHLPLAQGLSYVYPEAVVPEEDIAYAGNENLHAGSTSSGEKKKRCPGWRIMPNSRPGSSSTTTAS